jgi:predicted dehydrogenase
MVAETTALHTEKRKRYAMVGTGARGTGMWGTEVLNNYGRYAEFVGLCDKNIGRVEYAKKIMNVSCSVFTDFETMMRETKPDMLIVATMCSTIASL